MRYNPTTFECVDEQNRKEMTAYQHLEGTEIKRVQPLNRGEKEPNLKHEFWAPRRRRLPNRLQPLGLRGRWATVSRMKGRSLSQVHETVKV